MVWIVSLIVGLGYLCVCWIDLWLWYEDRKNRLGKKWKPEGPKVTIYVEQRIDGKLVLFDQHCFETSTWPEKE